MKNFDINELDRLVADYKEWVSNNPASSNYSQERHLLSSYMTDHIVVILASLHQKEIIDQLVIDWRNAHQAYMDFERDNPNNLGNEWEKLLYAQQDARTALIEYADEHVKTTIVNTPQEITSMPVEDRKTNIQHDLRKLLENNNKTIQPEEEKMIETISDVFSKLGIEGIQFE